MITLKGFPTEISEYIELPDIAELLMQPSFFDTDIDDAYKYGTDFQRELIEMTPLRNTKTNISVLSHVKLLAPSYRSCTSGGQGIPDFEWHIDNEEEVKPYIYNQERDIVHLLSNNVTCRTEFIKNEINLDLPSDLPFDDFMDLFRSDLAGPNNWGIIPEMAPSNRIITFTNHMHRATDPIGYELRYLFRIVETNRVRKPGRYNPAVNESNVMYKGKYIPSVVRDNDRIIIYIPKSEGINPKLANDKGCSSKETSELKTLDISHIGWETDLLDNNNNVLKDFTPKNSIMLLGTGEFDSRCSNKRLVEFFQGLDRLATITSEDGTHTFSSLLKKDFYNEDPVLGKIFGIHVLLNSHDIMTMKSGVRYKIILRNNSKYILNIHEDLWIVKDENRFN